MGEKIKTRPNIVFYFSDQQRYDTLGCYGQSMKVTPNLDKLADSGTLFENAYTCQPVCGPARSCLQTGRYAAAAGCFTNGMALDFAQKLLADHLKEAGYETAYVGKWHLATDHEKGRNFETTAIPPDRRGGYTDYWMAADVLEFTSHGYNGYVFDTNGNRCDFTGYRSDCINNFAIDYIRNRNSSKPFFLFISQIEPHHQNDHGHYEGPDGSKARFKNFIGPLDLQAGKGDWEEEYPDYLGCCHRLDRNVGDLIETLKEQGIFENTILIYTSDHGSHFKTRNREYKRSCHDSSLHVPLIIHGPGFEGKGRISDLISLIDLPPTILECAGADIPEEYHGSPVQSLFDERKLNWKKEVFVQISESQIGRAIRTEKYKYGIRAEGDAWKEKGAVMYYEDVLYDLENDPFEMHNLIADSSMEPVRDYLAGVMKKNMVQAGEQAPEILPWDERPKSLENDGYEYNHK